MKMNHMILVLAVSTSSLASAKTPRLARNLVKAAKAMKGHSKPRPIAPQCANFSGHWQGKCFDNHGGESESELRIEQEDCFSVTMDGQEFNINGTLSVHSKPSNESDDLAFDGTIYHQWNSNQTKLHGLTTLLLGVENYPIAAVATDSMWLSGDQLRTKGEYNPPAVGVEGPLEFSPLVIDDCTYDRVPTDK